MASDDFVMGIKPSRPGWEAKQRMALGGKSYCAYELTEVDAVAQL